MFEQILGGSAGDAVGHQLSALFQAHAQRHAVRGDRGARGGALTTRTCRPARGRIMLLARSDMASFVDSLVAPLSVINALIVAVGMSRRGRSSRRSTGWNASGKNTTAYMKSRRTTRIEIYW